MAGRLKYDKNLWRCICLCTLIAVITFGYYIYIDGGIFTLRDDFNIQEIPFNTAMNGFLKQWEGEWCWNVDLGTQFVGGYSFYNLGSPFFWISLLFHKNTFPYIVAILYILKYIIAGCTSYLYIKLFVRDSKYAILGALLYAFSGFQSMNLLFYHFHDVVAFFPLLLLGIEGALEKKNYSLFVISIFLNCLVNYFFFIGEVIFLVLYFLFRFWDKPYRMVKNMMVCILCGIIGVGMASFLFIPSVLFILGNSRSHSQIDLRLLFPAPIQILYYIKGFLLPGEAMHNQSCVVNQMWTSTSCYLPLVGISLPLAYVLKKRDWLAKLLILLFVIAFSPLLSSVFYLFTTNYQRWWYMLILIMATASAIVLEKKEDFSIKKAVMINIIMIVMFVFVLTKLKWLNDNESLIFRKLVFDVLVGISLSGLLWIMIALKSKKQYYVGILSGIFMTCFFTTFLTIYLYRQNSSLGNDYMKNYVVGSKLERIDDQYRYNVLSNIFILSGDAIGVYSFNSTVSPSIAEFDKTFGYERNNFSLNVNSIPGLSQLVAARYRLMNDITSSDEIADEIDVYDKKYYVVADKACPIGFAYDSYILMEDLLEIDVNARGIAALDNLVVDFKDENIVTQIMKKNNPADYAPEDTDSISSMVDKALENAVKNFHRDNSGFTCETNYNMEKAVYFSVPYDNGWNAYVDDVQTEIIKTNGMMTIIVPEGEHQITFFYKTPGLRAGIWISIASFILFSIYMSCLANISSMANKTNISVTAVASNKIF